MAEQGTDRKAYFESLLEQARALESEGKLKAGTADTALKAYNYNPDNLEALIQSLESPESLQPAQTAQKPANEWDRLVAYANSVVAELAPNEEGGEESGGLPPIASSAELLGLYQQARQSLREAYYDHNPQTGSLTAKPGVTRAQLAEFNSQWKAINDAEAAAKQTLAKYPLEEKYQQEAISILSNFGLLREGATKDTIESSLDTILSRADVDAIAMIQRAAAYLNQNGGAYQQQAKWISDKANSMLRSSATEYEGKEGFLGTGLGAKEGAAERAMAAEAASGIDYYSIINPPSEGDNAYTRGISEEQLGNLLNTYGEYYYDTWSQGQNRFNGYYRKQKDFIKWPLLKEEEMRTAKDKQDLAAYKKRLEQAKEMYMSVKSQIMHMESVNKDYYNQCLMWYYSNEPGWEDKSDITEWASYKRAWDASKKAGEYDQRTEGAFPVIGSELVDTASAKALENYTR